MLIFSNLNQVFLRNLKKNKHPQQKSRGPKNLRLSVLSIKPVKEELFRVLSSDLVARHSQIPLIFTIQHFEAELPGLRNVSHSERMELVQTLMRWRCNPSAATVI